MTVKFTSEQLEGLKSLYAKGHSMNSLAKMMHCDPKTLKCYLMPGYREHINARNKEAMRRKRATNKAQHAQHKTTRNIDEATLTQRKAAALRDQRRNAPLFAECKFYSCPEFAHCQDKQCPQDCAVWRMLTNPELDVLP